ncbi:MAG TPA: hypothetical protein VK163_06605 [Opitutaceae bacterium]|nr:hypothetical protein [Opitutaceae bacterium]
MSAATTNLNIDERPGNFLGLIVAAATTIYLGILVARDAAGKAVPASDTPGLRVMGRAEHGATAAEVVQVKRGIFRYNNSATNALTAASVGKLCVVEDDNTVASTSTNKIVAGRVVEVDSDGVWVDTADIPISALPADTTTNGAAAGAADLAALKTESEAAGDTLRATIAALSA